MFHNRVHANTMHVYVIVSLFCVSASFIVAEGRLAQVYSASNNDCELEHGECNHDKNGVSLALKSAGCTEWCQCKGVTSRTGDSVIYQWSKQACPPGILFDDSLGNCDYFSTSTVQCTETTTTTDTPAPESPHTDGNGDTDDDCQREHGVCNIYTYEHRLALKSSGCMKWCQCEKEASPSGGSATYKWTKQECPPGRLFDDRRKYCYLASRVQCDDTTTVADTHSTYLPHTDGDAEADAGCQQEHGECSQCIGVYTRYKALKSSGCVIFCQCTTASTQSGGSVTCKWANHTCPPGLLFDEDRKICNYAHLVQCKVETTTETSTTPATTTDINECSSNPCANGATCTNLQNRYTCTCLAGWQGTNCDEDINECLSNPCENWGTCINLQNRYTCTCPAGWKGINCEEDINECSSNPCANGGTCNNLQNQYTCICPGGWQGTNCDEDINECLSNPCANDATCNNLQNRYTCTCTEGWQGNNCDEDINECLSNPCANGATCTNLQNRYTCTCTGAWQGTNCENVKPLEECYKCNKEPSNTACNRKTEVCKEKEKSCETTVKWNGHKYEVSKGCKKAIPSKAKAKKSKSKSKSKLGCKKNGKKIDCRYECTTNLCNEPLPAKTIDE